MNQKTIDRPQPTKKTYQQKEPPKKWRVKLLDDPVSPFDLVVLIVESVFSVSEEVAAKIAKEIHESGSALVGLFTRDVAESKVDQISRLATENQMPLTSEAVEE